MRYLTKIDSDNKVINVIMTEDEEFVKNLNGNYIETFPRLNCTNWFKKLKVILMTYK